MLPNRDAAEIEKIIGYTFADKALLSACFTHASYANVYKTESNERLEFLGDAVLGFLVAKALYASEGESEGRMTERRQKLVSEAPLKECIVHAGLDRFLLFSGSAPNAKAISSLFEAIVAGIYLDGGMEEAEKVVRRFLAPLLLKEGESRNFKGELQEFLQARGQEKTVYTVVKTEGAPHAPLFTVCAEGAGRAAFGKGHSKAEAEKAAARALLFQLQNPSGEN